MHYGENKKLTLDEVGQSEELQSSFFGVTFSPWETDLQKSLSELSSACMAPVKDSTLKKKVIAARGGLSR